MVPPVALHVTAKDFPAPAETVLPNMDVPPVKSEIELGATWTLTGKTAWFRVTEALADSPWSLQSAPLLR